MMKKKACYIGVDPDLVKSGFAVYYPATGKLTGSLFDFFKLKEILSEFKNTYQDDLLVRIEGGWLNSKSNFHGHPKQSKAVGERIAKNVGENHACGKLIVQMCEYLKIPHEIVKPTQSKVNSQFFKKLTGLDVKNQEIIDASMLCFGF
jgi:hypothetical protein